MNHRSKFHLIFIYNRALWFGSSLFAKVYKPVSRTIRVNNVENIVEKEALAQYEQMLHFQQCFQVNAKMCIYGVKG